MTTYLNTSQLCEKLGGRSETSIRRDIALGHLPEPLKLNGTLLWPEDMVEKFVEKTEAKGVEPFPSFEAKREAGMAIVAKKDAVEAKISEHHAAIMELEFEGRELQEQVNVIFETPIAK